MISLKTVFNYIKSVNELINKSIFHVQRYKNMVRIVCVIMLLPCQRMYALH